MTNHTMADSTENEKYRMIAEAAAQYAHEACFSSRRGILPSDTHMVVAYDNNPPVGSAIQRDRDLAALKQVMIDNGAELVAEASYPVGGPSHGYTVAFVWFGPGELDDVLEFAWKRVLRTRGAGGSESS